MNRGDTESKKTHQGAYFDDAEKLISTIIDNNDTKMLASDKRVQIEWLKPLLEDIIDLVAKAPTSQHEILGIKVICNISTVFALKCLDFNNMDQMKELANELCLWTRFKELEQGKTPANTSKHLNDDLLWLLDLWFGHLIYSLQQPLDIWHFSPEFFILFIRKQHTIGWKLVEQGFKRCPDFNKNRSKFQLFLLLQEALCSLQSPVTKNLMENASKFAITPMKDLLLGSNIHPGKKTQCSKIGSLLLRKLKEMKVETKLVHSISKVLKDASTAYNENKKEKKTNAKSIDDSSSSHVNNHEKKKTKKTDQNKINNDSNSQKKKKVRKEIFLQFTPKIKRKFKASIPQRRREKWLSKRKLNFYLLLPCFICQFMF